MPQSKLHIHMSGHQITAMLIFITFLVGCDAPPSDRPSVTLTYIPSLVPSQTPSFTPSLTPSTTPIPSQTRTSIPTSSPTEKPITIVFYGDSILKIGDVIKQGKVGYSILDFLTTDLDPDIQIITSNHGGRKAKWGFENLDNNVLSFNPDIVSIWWGMNDLDGCPGIFDRDTNRVLQYKLDAMLNSHINYLRLQIDVLLGRKIPVILITPMPILGTLPWSHISPDNELVWENNYRCDFNIGLEKMAEIQRKLVSDYQEEQKPVYLVDAWQIYKDHPNTDNMYMDILHPGAQGAKFISEEWLHVFQSIQK